MTIVDNIVAELDQREAHLRAKIAQFRKLLRDPEIAPLVQRVLSNGHIRKLQPPRSFQGSHRKDGGGIREAIRGLSDVLPKGFTAIDVLKTLEAKHFKFGAKDRKGAVRNALAALVKTEVLNVVRPAEGDQPQVYEFTEGEV